MQGHCQGREGQAAEFSGNFTLDRNVVVILKGGFDTSFNGNPGWSSIHGTLTINNGSLILAKIVVW